MNVNEIMAKFDELYEKMSRSSDVKDMKLFGKVMREAMAYLAENKLEKADELTEKLCAMEWCNYVTRREAEEIVKHMVPSARWSEEAMKRKLEELGLQKEEAPYYNEHALWVVVSMKYSDDAKTLAEEVMGKKVEEVEELEMLKVCHALALDVLKDADGVFDVRHYFCL